MTQLNISNYILTNSQSPILYSIMHPHPTQLFAYQTLSPPSNRQSTQIPNISYVQDNLSSSILQSQSSSLTPTQSYFMNVRKKQQKDYLNQERRRIVEQISLRETQEELPDMTNQLNRQMFFGTLSASLILFHENRTNMREVTNSRVENSQQSMPIIRNNYSQQLHQELCILSSSLMALRKSIGQLVTFNIVKGLVALIDKDLWERQRILNNNSDSPNINERVTLVQVLCLIRDILYVAYDENKSIARALVAEDILNKIIRIGSKWRTIPLEELERDSTAYLGQVSINQVTQIVSLLGNIAGYSDQLRKMVYNVSGVVLIITFGQYIVREIRSFGPIQLLNQCLHTYACAANQVCQIFEDQGRIYYPNNNIASSMIDQLSGVIQLPAGLPDHINTLIIQCIYRISRIGRETIFRHLKNSPNIFPYLAEACCSQDSGIALLAVTTISGILMANDPAVGNAFLQFGIFHKFTISYAKHSSMPQVVSHIMISLNNLITGNEERGMLLIRHQIYNIVLEALQNASAPKNRRTAQFLIGTMLSIGYFPLTNFLVSENHIIRSLAVCLQSIWDTDAEVACQILYSFEKIILSYESVYTPPVNGEPSRNIAIEIMERRFQLSCLIQNIASNSKNNKVVEKADRVLDLINKV